MLNYRLPFFYVGSYVVQAGFRLVLYIPKDNLELLTVLLPPPRARITAV